MYRSVAGLELDPEEPGYRHIIIRPRPGGSLRWAEAKLRTPFGQASIRWELEGSRLLLDFEVPEKCRATLRPPPRYAVEQVEYEAGRSRVVLEIA